MDALRRIASGHVAVFDLTSRRRLRGADVWAMRIAAPLRRPGRGTPRPLNRPLAAFPLVPAGTYLVSAKRHAAGDRMLMVGIGNDQFAIVTQPVADFEAGLRLHLPAGACALPVRGGAGARGPPDAIQLGPPALEAAPRPPA